MIVSHDSALVDLDNAPVDLGAIPRSQQHSNVWLSDTRRHDLAQANRSNETGILEHDLMFGLFTIPLFDSNRIVSIEYIVPLQWNTARFVKHFVLVDIVMAF